MSDKFISSRLLIYFGRGLHPVTISFLVGQTMQDYIALDYHTETTLIMETTVLTTALDFSIKDNTTALNSSLLLPEFGDKENDPIPVDNLGFTLSSIPVDNLGIYSELDHQRLKDIRSLSIKMFPPSLTHPKALKELVLSKAQMCGFNVTIQGSSIICRKHNPPTCRKKNSNFLPLLKRRKTVSTPLKGICAKPNFYDFSLLIFQFNASQNKF
jgi:hypothetical protein